jgi:hypothetical protein
MIGELARIPDELWRETPSHTASEVPTIKWLPILNLVPCRIELGLSENGYWVRHAGNSITEFTDNDPLVFLLPCLEIDYLDLKRRLASAVESIGLPSSLAENFPYFRLILTGAKSDSAQWVPLALKWLEEHPVDAEAAVALDRLLRENPRLRLPKKAWDSVRKWRKNS